MRKALLVWLGVNALVGLLIGGFMAYASPQRAQMAKAWHGPEWGCEMAHFHVERTPAIFAHIVFGKPMPFYGSVPKSCQERKNHEAHR